MAFLSSLTYTENCYSCKYAQKKRISDITIGDAWGSDLADEEIKNGIFFNSLSNRKRYTVGK